MRGKLSAPYMDLMAPFIKESCPKSMATDRCEMHCNLLLNILNLGLIFSLCPEKCLLRVTLWGFFQSLSPGQEKIGKDIPIMDINT